METVALWKRWKNKPRFSTVTTALGKLAKERRVFHSFHSPYDYTHWNKKQQERNQLFTQYT